MNNLFFIYVILFINKFQVLIAQSVCSNLEEGKIYYFNNAKDDCKLDTYYGIACPGTQVDTHPLLNYSGLKWYVKKIAGTPDKYLIISVLNNLVVDSTGKITKSQKATCSLDQQFTFVKGNGSGCYILYGSDGNLALSNRGQNSFCTKFNDMHLIAKDNSSDQQWEFIEAPEPSNWSPVYPSCSLDATAGCVDKGTPYCNLNCNDAQSFYFEGYCYKLNDKKAFTEAVVDCISKNSTLAIVKSADVAEMMISVASKKYGTPLAPLWILAPNGNNSEYLKLDKSKSTDGDFLLNVNVTGGMCTNVDTSSLTNEMIQWITDSRACTETFPYFCETPPTFQQKGCQGQALSRNPCVVLSTRTSLTLKDCGVACAKEPSCTGFNYNQSGQKCEILQENSSTEEIICDGNWAYFERI